MYFYDIFDLNLSSNVPLPGLQSSKSKNPETSFSLESSPPKRFEGPWLQHYLERDGNIWLSCAVEGSSYLLNFPGICDFVLSQVGKRIRCHPSAGADTGRIAHLLCNHVIPLSFSIQGRLALHASSVAGPKGAIAFAGFSGQGKSTMAAALCSRGFTLLTDDCLLLSHDEGRFFVVPSYPGLWLSPDSFSLLFDKGKRSAALTKAKTHITEESRLLSFAQEKTALNTIYFMEGFPEKNLRIRRVPLRDAFMRLVQHAHRLDVSDRARLADEFADLGRLVTRCEFYEIEMPRDLQALPLVAEMICRHQQDPAQMEIEVA